MPKYGAYSPSKLGVAVCGYAFDPLYVNQSPDRKKYESLPQARGSAVHEVLAKITEKFVANKTQEASVFTDAEVRRWVVDALHLHPAAAEETEEILQMAGKYLMNPPDPLTHDAEVEQTLAVKLVGGEFIECDYSDPEAYARGRIDIKMISDDLSHAIVFDHKTQPNIEKADTFQLGFYAWLLFKTNPYLQEVQTILHFARYGTYSKPYVWTRDRLAEIEDQIVTKITQAEERTDWSPVPNKLCQYCPLLYECPAQAQYFERDSKGQLKPMKETIKILGDQDKAIEIAGAIAVLSNLVTEMKKELRAYVETAKSPISIPGLWYGFEVKKGVVNWDHANKKQREELYAVFEKHGIDPREYMGFSETFSKKALQGNSKALARDLNALLVREDETEFKSRKH